MAAESVLESGSGSGLAAVSWAEAAEAPRPTGSARVSTSEAVAASDEASDAGSESGSQSAVAQSASGWVAAAGAERPG